MYRGPSCMRLSKPLIAAVSGYAVAGGLELTVLADLRVMEESPIMGIFCCRFDVPLIDGGEISGLSLTLDLILTSRPVKAQEALTFGLGNRVVPDGQACEGLRLLFTHSISHEDVTLNYCNVAAVHTIIVRLEEMSSELHRDRVKVKHSSFKVRVTRVEFPQEVCSEARAFMCWKEGLNESILYQL
ncbi:carnitinyl-CoA dehydratase [Myxocyprinus asiaticus]|uniref:carnitinyl-CoA dehydratase n=1 Tax=Myxocyprinus asiaticus TaxID=70543 RepID=UPI002223D4C3|nr:carnitinyl-CoA dehydratase [Myxocyprinus asiaticus]